jgi:hypothetical protein
MEFVQVFDDGGRHTIPLSAQIEWMKNRVLPV